jgi:hypothetical protein
VRLTGPSCGRRVEVANVVARLVRSQLRELESGTDPGGAPIAGQGARGVARNDQIERLDEPLGHRTGALAGGRRG